VQTFDNDAAGHDRIVKQLATQRPACIVVVESTGGTSGR
jgi:hypothetical protein